MVCFPCNISLNNSFHHDNIMLHNNNKGCFPLSYQCEQPFFAYFVPGCYMRTKLSSLQLQRAHCSWTKEALGESLFMGCSENHISELVGNISFQHSCQRKWPSFKTQKAQLLHWDLYKLFSLINFNFASFYFEANNKPTRLSKRKSELFSVLTQKAVFAILE